MKLIREHDDFEWVREIPLDIPFSNLKIGELYRIETTEVLREALQACEKTERLFYAYMGIPTMKSKDPYGIVFCDHERDDIVDTIYLEFYDDNHRDLGSFWVTEDMVKFYFLKSDIKENEEDDWGWIDKSEYNPWDKYEYIEIDVEPKQENLELLVNLALKKDYITGKSKEQWSRNMTSNILDIMDYFYGEGRAYIRMEDGDLWYGHSLQPYGKWTKYSEIFGENINESEEDDFDWVRDTNFDTDMFINKAFYFDPIAEEDDKDYTKLVNHLINLGFESQYATPTVLNDQAVGLYVYRDYNGDLKYVYTTGLDDDEDYELHIKRYASEESEDYGQSLEVVDAREFIKLL